MEGPPHPEPLTAYLRTHRPAHILVADSTGETRSLYDAQLQGDTLRGTSKRVPPAQRLTIPLASVQSVTVPRFSAVRTLELAGAVVAVVGIVKLLLPAEKISTVP